MSGRLSTRLGKLEDASGVCGIEIVVKDGETPPEAAALRRGKGPIRVFISEDDAKL